MIEYYLLEELVVFSQTGTLAKTAAQLDITQPAVTHSMQKLEEQLQVKLFERTPNRIYLTETGKYAAREAKKLLDDNQDFSSKIKRFEQSQTTITIAANAPGPLIVVRALHNPQVKIQGKLRQNQVEQLVAEGQITIFLTNHPLNLRDISSVYLGIEKIAVNLPKNSPLAQQQTLSYQDLQGQTIISPLQIGFWQEIYENEIPDAHFIYQEKPNAYSEILNYSVLPYFTTNATILDKSWGLNLPGDRVNIPLQDPSAQQKFYAVFLKQNQKRLLPLIEQIQDQWAKIDQ